MSLVPERDYFFCLYCGSFHFPTPSPEGVRILSEEPLKVHCPVCNENLFRASIQRFPAVYCQKCRGVGMAQFVFGQAVLYLRARASGPSDPPRRLDPSELERHVHCPSCGQWMLTHPYAGPGNIVIDTCGTCGLVWLDHGEFRQVIDAPGGDRGRPWYLDEEA